jgi:hypothetical protein
MKAFLWLVFFAIATFGIYAETPKDIFQSSISSLEDASGSTNEAAIFSRLESAWAQLTLADKAAAWPQMSMAYVNESSRLLDAKDSVAASGYLALAGALNKNFGGRLEYATKSPNFFFDRLARLQVKIATRTGFDPLEGLVDYLFQKRGNQYIVAREELDPEINGVTIGGVKESESLLQVHYLETHGEDVSIESTRWFIGPKGNVADTLRQANREVLQDQYGRYVTGTLRGTVLSNAGQEDHITPSAQSTPVPPLAMPVQQTKSMAQTTPSPKLKAQTPHSLSFPILPVAIVVALIVGIVLLILSRKSK